MTLAIVRALHVLLGVFWGGTLLFVMFFLNPAVRSVGPAGGKVMQELQKRGHITTMLIVGTLTVLTGIYVLWAVSGGFGPYMGTPQGIVLSTGGLTGILVLVGLAHMIRPTMKKLGPVAQRVQAAEGEPDAEDVAEVQRLQGKLTRTIKVMGVLMIVTLVLMAWGAHGM